MPEGDERDLTELMIRTQRTISTSSQSTGTATPTCSRTSRIAEEICRKLTNRPEIMPAQVGIWSYLLVRGLVGAANVVLEPLTDVLDDPATAWFAPEIKSCMGYGAFYQGRLARGAPLARRGVGGLPARARSRRPPLRSGPSRTTRCRSPRWRWPASAGLRGSTEESALWERRALDHGRGTRLPFRAVQRGVRLGVPGLDPHDHGQPGGGPRVRAAHDRDRRAVPLRLLPAARDAVRPDARARPAL